MKFSQLTALVRCNLENSVNFCVSSLKEMLSILYFQRRDQDVERSRTLFQKDWSAMTSPGKTKLEGTGEPSPKHGRPSLAQKGRIRAKVWREERWKTDFYFLTARTF